MSLTPPKFIQMLRKRDQDDLLARLRALADKWEQEARDWGPDGANAMDAAASELREVLDAHD